MDIVAFIFGAPQGADHARELRETRRNALEQQRNRAAAEAERARRDRVRQDYERRKAAVAAFQARMREFSAHGFARLDEAARNGACSIEIILLNKDQAAELDGYNGFTYATRDYVASSAPLAVVTDPANGPTPACLTRLTALARKLLADVPEFRAFERQCVARGLTLKVSSVSGPDGHVLLTLKF